MELTKRHKTYSITYYHRGIELEVICVTTSKKRFAELLGDTTSHINNYCYVYDLRYPICNENPEVLYAKRGMGGEGLYIFKANEIKTFDEFKKIIDEHRKTYSSYNDYLTKTNQR